jgi:hypothetical protein
MRRRPILLTVCLFAMGTSVTTEARELARRDFAKPEGMNRGAPIEVEGSPPVLLRS